MALNPPNAGVTDGAFSSAALEMCCTASVRTSRGGASDGAGRTSGTGPECTSPAAPEAIQVHKKTRNQEINEKKKSKLAKTHN
jgi:hypothetical protein